MFTYQRMKNTNDWNSINLKWKCSFIAFPSSFLDLDQMALWLLSSEAVNSLLDVFMHLSLHCSKLICSDGLCFCSVRMLGESGKCPMKPKAYMFNRDWKLYAPLWVFSPLSVTVTELTWLEILRWLSVPQCLWGTPAVSSVLYALLQNKSFYTLYACSKFIYHRFMICCLTCDCETWITMMSQCCKDKNLSDDLRLGILLFI